MSNDAKFIDGLIVKAPNENAPDYVKAKLSIKRQELIAWLQQQEGEWINADLKVSSAGKWYAAVDTWKPNQDRAGQSRPTQAAPKDESLESDDPPF
jgi:hypothetical protein